MEPTPIQRPTLGPETCPTCKQKTHPGGTCPGFGPSDSDQLTAARLEIDDLKKENAKLLTEIKAARERAMKYAAETQMVEARSEERWEQMTVHKNRADQLEKMLALVEATVKTARQLHEQEIPF